MTVQLRRLTELTRRRLLGHVPTGLGGVGLIHLLSQAKSAAETAGQPERNQTHHVAKAKRVLQIFCPGAASHMDLWEYKPSLEKYHGTPLPGEENLVSELRERSYKDKPPIWLLRVRRRAENARWDGTPVFVMRGRIRGLADRAKDA